MSDSQKQPVKHPVDQSDVDWNERAAVFDRWLPYIQPVAEALLDLADVSEGMHVLDVASGTGEPALTLARRFSKAQITIVGVDGATAMVSRANQKTRDEGLSNLSFQHMQAESLQFSDASFDRVTSRFGAMLFNDSLLGLQEMRRVLRLGGTMALAVWGEFHKQTTIFLIWQEVLKRMPKDKHPALPRMGRLGAPGALENLLAEAQFKSVEVRPLRVTYHFDDFEDYWSVNTESGILQEPLASFSASERLQIKDTLRLQCETYEQDGGLVFQNEAILARMLK